MMYCPENPRTKLQWERTYPFLRARGLRVHHGELRPWRPNHRRKATGSGCFTIYDWGNGAAAEAYNRMLDHFGPDLVQREE